MQPKLALPRGFRPRRTMLYVSADNPRHLDKAHGLTSDCLIFDLHEPVSPQHKERAREQVAATLETNGARGHERILRVNRPDSPWWADDLALAARLPLDAVLIPGLESAEALRRALADLDAAGAPQMPVMVMVDSARGVLAAPEIAGASERMRALVVSTANLVASLRLPPQPDRQGLQASLSMVVLAARANDIAAIDGAHLDISEAQTCELACRQSRDLGFDGKAVIHPVQLPYTNDAFSPKPRDLAKKRTILEAMEKAAGKGRSFALLDGKLLQPVEIQAARRCIALDEAIRARIDNFV